MIIKTPALILQALIVSLKSINVENKMLIQLPGDVILIGYKQTRPFHYEQVFRSVSADFIGTENEFLENGKAYSYIQTGKYTRALIQGK